MEPTGEREKGSGSMKRDWFWTALGAVIIIWAVALVLVIIANLIGRLS